MTDVQILIKSFLRPQVLRDCLRNIRKLYANDIILADDSPEFDLDVLTGTPNLQYHKLPAHSGLSTGRNHLLSQVTAPYFLLLDHDHNLTDSQTIEKLMVVMNETKASIVAGLLWDLGAKQPRKYCGYFTGDGKDITLNHYDFGKIKTAVAVGRQLSVPYFGCRYSSNFFLGKTDDFHRYNIHWDDELKLMEHEDFFIRFPTSLRIATAPTVTVSHNCCYENSKAESEYARFRYAKEHRNRARTKHGLKSEFFLERHGVIYDWTTWSFPEVQKCCNCSVSA